MRPIGVVSIGVICGLAACGGGDMLVRIDPESAGGNCADGGYVIYQGVDDNGDGVLQDEEVAGDGVYVCNGTAGTDGLDGLDGEDGEDGSGGGIDLGPVVEGTYVIDNSVDAALLAGVEMITGDLRINNGVTALELPDLIEVQGSIVITDNDTLGFVSLPSLTTIGGTLDVEYTETLADLGGFSSLTSAYAIYVAYNYALERIDLPDLAVTDSILIDENDVLTTLSLPSVPDGFVDGSSLEIDGNDELDMCVAQDLLTAMEDAGFTGSSYLDGGIACE